MPHSSYSIFKSHNIHKKDYMISILIPFVRFYYHFYINFSLLVVNLSTIVMIVILPVKIVKLICISNIIPYICTIQSRYNMKLNKIKAVLAEKGISQTWLAKQLGKSFSMVNAYACNRIQPNLETLMQIAVILQVDLKDLITDKDER